MGLTFVSRPSVCSLSSSATADRRSIADARARATARRLVRTADAVARLRARRRPGRRFPPGRNPPRDPPAALPPSPRARRRGATFGGEPFKQVAGSIHSDAHIAAIRDARDFTVTVSVGRSRSRSRSPPRHALRPFDLGSVSPPRHLESPGRIANRFAEHYRRNARHLPAAAVAHVPLLPPPPPAAIPVPRPRGQHPYGPFDLPVDNAPPRAYASDSADWDLCHPTPLEYLLYRPAPHATTTEEALHAWGIGLARIPLDATALPGSRAAAGAAIQASYASAAARAHCSVIEWFAPQRALEISRENRFILREAASAAESKYIGSDSDSDSDTEQGAGTGGSVGGISV